MQCFPLYDSCITNVLCKFSYPIVVIKMSIAKLLSTKLSLLMGYQNVSYQKGSYKNVSYKKYPLLKRQLPNCLLLKFQLPKCQLQKISVSKMPVIKISVPKCQLLNASYQKYQLQKCQLVNKLSFGYLSVRSKISALH